MGRPMSGFTRWGLVEPLDALRASLPWPRRLLIVGPGGLGDTVLTLPALQRIQRASPATEITWVGRRAYAGIVAMMGVTSFEPGEDFAARFDPQRFDAILSFADLGAEFLGGMERVAAVPLRIGPAGARQRPRWFNHLVWTSRLGRPRHEAQRNLRLLRPFGAGAAAESVELRASISLRAPETPLPGDLPAAGALVLHPYSMGHAREWPVDHWKSLAHELASQGRAVVFTGSAAEGERFAAAWPRAERPAGVHDAFGRLDLTQLAALLGRAAAIVACSTGPLHLAAALGTPTLGLYVPRKGLGVERWAALGPAALSVQVARRCARRCQNGACPCIEALVPERIARALPAVPNRAPAADALAPWHVHRGLAAPELP
jgi:heptosyltransferase-3